MTICPFSSIASSNLSDNSLSFFSSLTVFFAIVGDNLAFSAAISLLLILEEELFAALSLSGGVDNTDVFADDERRLAVGGEGGIESIERAGVLNPIEETDPLDVPRCK